MLRGLELTFLSVYGTAQQLINTLCWLLLFILNSIMRSCLKINYSFSAIHLTYSRLNNGLPGGTSDKAAACQCRRPKRCRFSPWVRKIPWRRAWQPTLVFLPGESHGQRSLAGYCPQSCTESDITEGT